MGIKAAQVKYGRLIKGLEHGAAAIVKDYVTLLRSEAAASRVLIRELRNRIAVLKARLRERGNGSTGVR